jgi:hypothetical protein
VEEISNSATGPPSCLVRGNDGSLKPIGERFQPILTLDPFDGGFPESLQIWLWHRHAAPPV